MKHKLTAMLLIVTLALILIATWWIWAQSVRLPAECRGLLKMQDNFSDGQASLDGVVVMTNHGDGSGYYTLHGTVLWDHQRYQLARMQHQQWRHLYGNTYETVAGKVERFGADNLPAGILDRIVSGTTPGTRRQIALSRTPDNAWVIGNFSSPVLMCVGQTGEK